jgi:D-glycero-D-manno-heptose 1,7-bisphosphate phosphatase
MRPWTDHAPKHLYPFHTKPFAAHLIERLAGQGFERVLWLLGHRAEATIEYFQAREPWGLSMDYAATPAAWQTTLRIRAAIDRLDPVFLLLYCDNIWPLAFLRLWESYRRSGAAVQLAAYDNTDGYSTANLELDRHRVLAYGKTAAATAVDIGFALVDRRVVEELPAEDAPLEAMLYPRLASCGQLSAFVSSHRYYGVGNPSRLPATERFLAPQRAVLVDRDGVLNCRPPIGEYVRSWNDWEWMPGAREALDEFRQAGWAVYVITNQAGLARGMVSRPELERIHARMIAESGGAISRVYVCPHGWDENCPCRKPRPGLFFQAQRDLDLDLSRTWFIGDDERDAQAALTAGCRYLPLPQTRWEQARRIVVEENICVS